MKNKLFLSAVIAISFLLLTPSCKPKDKLKDKAEKFSKKFCECAGPSAEFLTKMKNTEPENIEELVAESEKIGKEMQDCMGEEYMDPFKDMLDEEKETFDKHFQEIVTAKCPEIAKSFGL